MFGHKIGEISFKFSYFRLNNIDIMFDSKGSFSLSENDCEGAFCSLMFVAAQWE